MKKLPILLLFFLAGLVAGCVCGIMNALAAINAHAYWETGLYVLAAEQIMRHLLSWMAAGGCAFALCGLMFALGSRMSRKSWAAVCTGYIALLCAALFFTGPHITTAAVFGAACFLLLPCALLCMPPAGRWLLGRKRLVTGCSLACLLVLLTVSAWFAVNTMRDRPAGPSIVLIVIDCLRPDHLTCYGYGRDTSPTIDALAQTGRRYERAYVTAPWTKPSVASLLSSLLPARHGLNNPNTTAPDRLLLLAEVLRNTGYTNLFINGGNVFLKKDFNLHQGFHHYDYLPHRTRSAADVARMFLGRVAEIGKAKYFAYVHFMDAHAPYTVNSHNTRYAEKIIDAFAPGDLATRLPLQREPDAPCNRDPALRQYFRDLYDGQIRYIDDAVNYMLHGLTRLDRLNNTVFIITSDHGEEFWEHGSAEHGHSLYNELLHVPLIIAGSPVQKARITEPVQLIDIMPTVLDVAGISHEHLSLQGVSLIPGNDALDPGRALFASGTLYGPEAWCVIQNSRKLIYRSREKQGKWYLPGPQAPAGYQLFDLSRDPSERSDLAETRGVASELDDLLADYIRTKPLHVSEKSVMFGGDDMRRQLESLGYIQ